MVCILTDQNDNYVVLICLLSISFAIVPLCPTLTLPVFYLLNPSFFFKPHLLDFLPILQCSPALNSDV